MPPHPVAGVAEAGSRKKIRDEYAVVTGLAREYATSDFDYDVFAGRSTILLNNGVEPPSREPAELER